MAAYYDYVDTLRSLPKDLALAIERCRLAETDLRVDLARRGVDMSEYDPGRRPKYAPTINEPMVDDIKKPVLQERVIAGPEVTRGWVETTGRDLLGQLRWEHVEGRGITVPAMLAGIQQVRRYPNRYAKGTLPQAAVHHAESYAQGRAKLRKYNQPAYRPEYHVTRHVTH